MVSASTASLEGRQGDLDGCNPTATVPSATLCRSAERAVNPAPGPAHIPAVQIENGYFLLSLRATSRRTAAGGAQATARVLSTSGTNERAMFC